MGNTILAAVMADWEIHGIAYALDIIITWSSSNLAGHALALDVVSIQEIVLSLWTLRGALLLFPEITSIVANNQGVGGDTRNEHFRVGLEVFFFCIVHFIPQALRIFCGHSCARLFTGTFFGYFSVLCRSCLRFKTLTVSAQ